MRCVLYSIIILFACTCSKEKLDQGQVQSIISNTNNDLNDIIFINDTVGFIVGGNTFYENIILQTTDGGAHWTPMTILNNDNKVIDKLHYSNNHKVYAVGLDGKVYVNYLNGENLWHQHQNIWWEWIRDIHYFSSDTGITIAGKNWGYGSVQRVDSFGYVIKRDTFDFELNDLYVEAPDNYLVAGYGVILRSQDKGYTWQYTNASGDHFIKIIPAGNRFWAIGQYGTLLQSKDKGHSWQKIRNGSNPLKKRYLYNNIIFKDQSRGIVIGDKGLIMYTKNSGENWKIIDTFTDENLKGICFTDGKAIIVGSNGSIYMLKTDFF